MVIQLNLEDPDKKVREGKEAAKAVKAKKNKVAEVTDEVWQLIFAKKNSDADKRKLEEVCEAWKFGEFTKVETKTGKFTKADALRLYAVIHERNRQGKIDQMVANTPDNYKLIQTKDTFNEMLALLNREEIIGLDTETTGVDVYRDELVGVSLTLPKAGLHYYIPVMHDEGEQLDRDYVLDNLRGYLTNKHLKKVLHNAKFDLHIFIRYGIRVRGVAHDTMVGMWVLNENEMTYRLKDLATKYLNEPSDTFEELFGKDCKFNTVPLDTALVYAAKDTDLTYRLYLFQLAHLQRTGLIKLYQEIENPLIDVCVDMEQTGFTVDFNYAKPYAAQLKLQIEELETGLKRQFGDDVNFNSPAQLQVIFYDVLGLDDVSKKRSTDVKTLKALKGKHPGIELLLKYRELTKLLGTYVEALPQQIKPDGRLHGSFNQSATVTGRFASNNPNLQNLPPEARKLFVAPPGWVILGADFSQIEPRVLAHMSQDTAFMYPYLNGQDLYSTLAARVFKVPIEQCGDGSKHRKAMKVGLLAVMYGTSMFTLAEQLGITVEEAEKFIADFYESYPEVARFIKETHEAAKRNQYVQTMFDRKRRFPGHKQLAIKYDALVLQITEITKTKTVPLNFWKNKKIPYELKVRFQEVKGEVERVRRMAVNARIQGTAADIMKIAMINLYQLTQEKGWFLLGTVHDEALLLVPETITREEIAQIENCMTSVVKISVPLKTDVEIARRWGEGKSKAEWFQAA